MSPTPKSSKDPNEEPDDRKLEHRHPESRSARVARETGSEVDEEELAEQDLADDDDDADDSMGDLDVDDLKYMEGPDA